MFTVCLFFLILFFLLFFVVAGGERRPCRRVVRTLYVVLDKTPELLKAVYRTYGRCTPGKRCLPVQRWRFASRGSSGGFDVSAMTRPQGGGGTSPLSRHRSTLDNRVRRPWTAKGWGCYSLRSPLSCRTYSTCFLKKTGGGRGCWRRRRGGNVLLAPCVASCLREKSRACAGTVAVPCSVWPS